MSDKSKYTILEIITPRYVYIKTNVNVLCETLHEIWKSNFIIFDGSHFEYCNNGGRIKISGCFHQNSEIVWHGGHLCQISCFCPDVKMYYVKSPHYWLHSFFSHVDVYLNRTIVTTSTNTYPYRAYLVTLF